MKVSVIIPSYNGANKLPVILKSLKEQSIKDFNIVVVLDGSTDDSLEVLKRWHSQFADLIIVTQENKGRAAVRNMGAKIATGDLLIFFDDDMQLRPNCVEAHINHHLIHTRSILTGTQETPEELINSDFLLFKDYLGKKWSAGLLEVSEKPMSSNNYFLNAANFSIKKVLFYEIKGFDERLRDAEDFDLGTRAWLNGIDMFFSKKASGIHHDYPSVNQYIERLNQYRIAREHLLQIKPEIYSEKILMKVKTLPEIKRMFFSLLHSQWWLRSIENGTWKVLPSKIRFKLYDYIITAYTIL